MKFLDKLNLSPFSEWHYSIIDKEYVFDISKAQKVLGWNPKKSNNQLFQESYDWFMNNYKNLGVVGTTHKTKLNPKIFKLIDKL
jgi:dTDP-D-glucose 4,6-dehydratase